MVLLKKKVTCSSTTSNPPGLLEIDWIFSANLLINIVNLIGQVIFLVNKIFTIFFFSSEMKIEKLKANKEQ